MSVKLMAQVWEKDLTHSEQSILLAMADYADDDGRNCYPSYERIAWKTGYSTRQVTRIIKTLCDKGILFVLKPSAQHQSTHYWIRLSKASDKPPCSIDTMSGLGTDSDTSIDNTSSLNDTSIDTVSSLNDKSDSQGRQMKQSGWTSATSSIDMVSTNPSVNHHIEPLTEQEETHARDPLTVAWQQAYGADTIPAHIAKPLQSLVTECGMAATIHGIKASAGNPDGNNFLYIAKCARNYVPPAKLNGFVTGNGYAVDLPDAPLPISVQATSATTFAPPLAHDDPWAVALAELGRTLPGSAPQWLEGSRLVPNGELVGVPFYRVVMVQPHADPGWMQRQAEPAVRRKLGSILGKRITIEFTVDAKEQAMTHPDIEAARRAVHDAYERDTPTIHAEAVTA